MMIHPILGQAISEEHYQNLLREAQIERFYRRIKQHRPTLLQRSGDALIRLGHRLQAQELSKTVAPVLKT